VLTEATKRCGTNGDEYQISTHSPNQINSLNGGELCMANAAGAFSSVTPPTTPLALTWVTATLTHPRLRYRRCFRPGP
jgi:hypothetical protein